MTRRRPPMKLDRKDRELLDAFRGEFRLVRDALGDAGEISQTTAYRRLERLLEARLVEQQGHRYRTTDDGAAALRARSAPATAAPSPLDRVSPHLAQCPTPVHRALLELMLAAWVARTHEVSPDAQLSFVVFGPTMRWKTWLARLFATLIGESCDEVLLLLSAESGRSVFTRRSSRGETSWQRLVLDRRCVVFDEFQDAAPDVKRLCGVYLQGSMRVAYENETIRVLPVPVFTLNDRPADTLAGRVGMSDAQLRRSVPCDLAGVSIPKRLWTRGEEILAEARLETALEAPAPTATPADLAKKIQPLVRRNVRAELLPRIDVQRLAALASGMSAWLDADEAVSRTVEDYLRVVDTLGWTRDGWAVGAGRPVAKRREAVSEASRMREFLLQDAVPTDPRLDFDETLERVAVCVREAGLGEATEDRITAVLRELGGDDFAEILRLAGEVRGFREVLGELKRDIAARRARLDGLVARRDRLRHLLEALGGGEREARRGLAVHRALEQAGATALDVEEFVRQHAAIRERGLEPALTGLSEVGGVLRDLSRLRRQRAAARRDLRSVEELSIRAARELRKTRAATARIERGWSLLFRGVIPDDDVFWSHLRDLCNPLIRTLAPGESLRIASQVFGRVLKLAETRTALSTRPAE